MSGEVTALGSAVLRGPLLVGGAANFSGDVAVEGGAAVGGDLAVRGAAQVGGGLQVAGVARLLAGAQVGPGFELAPAAAGGIALRSRAGEGAVLEADARGQWVGVARGADTPRPPWRRDRAGSARSLFSCRMPPAFWGRGRGKVAPDCIRPEPVWPGGCRKEGGRA